MTTRDHQIFDQQVLSNGIQTYVYLDESRYSVAAITVPTGSASSFGEYAPGTFHFLEHLLYNRSQAYPKLNEYRKFAGLKGATFSASTAPFHTRYTLSCPSEHFSALWEGLFSAVFQPCLVDDDFEIERGTIVSERRKKERWFPGSTELGQYIDTKWLNNVPLSIEQRLGSDTDLRSITKQTVERAHAKGYFTPGIRVVAAGAADFEGLFESMGELSVSELPLPIRYEHLKWANREYHSHSFRDVNRFVLRVGGIISSNPDYLRFRARTFILVYLTNSTHGALFTWLREDLGWVYELGFITMHGLGEQSLWTLRFPLANQNQVEVVRREYLERISTALSNQLAVNAEVDRITCLFQAYSHSLLASVVDDAHSKLEQYGRITSDQEFLNCLEMFRDTSFLQSVWNEAANPVSLGSFCATPSI